MEKLFELLGENPLWIFVIILAVVCIIVSSAKKKNPQQNNDNGTSVGENRTAGVNTANSNIGDVDKTEVVSGYYRYQDDVMIVAIVILVIIVQVLQELGLLLAKKLDKRIK